jgi:hypothetical protein
VQADKPRNGDEPAVTLLKWIAAALLVMNGAALALAAATHGADEALFDGSGRYHAAGQLCALLGGGCWAMAYSSMPAAGETGAEQAGSSDQAVAFGAMAIMLWVASLTTFVVGCEHVSWAPERKALHRAEGGARAGATQVAAGAPQAARPLAVGATAERRD